MEKSNALHRYINTYSYGRNFSEWRFPFYEWEGAC